MKKIIALLLALITVFSLASCGKTAEKGKTETKEKEKKEKEYVWEDYKDVESEDFDLRFSILPKRNLDYYEEKIQAFEAKPIEEGKIVFYGSSGFTRWSTEYGNVSLESAVTSSTGEHVCINRGFGGSTMHELCYYYERVIKPLKPKAIVVTSFLNDAGLKYTNEEMMKLVQWFFAQARKDFPEAKLYITDWRPTAKPVTAEAVTVRKDMNKRLLAYSKAHPDVKVIELSKAKMFYIDDESAENGSYTDINKAIFIEDQVHYTPEGYKRYAEVFKKELADVLG